MPAQGGTVSALKQSEREFQAAVIQYARLHGWLVAHFHDSRRQVGDRLVGDADAAGFPDLVMARNGFLIFAELKTERGRVSRAQRQWLDALSLGTWWLQQRPDKPAAGLRVCLWRPSDWPEIERELSAKERG
jgi:hypothetical protein